MKEFVVHMIPGSPFGRCALATLEEKGVRYRLAALTPASMRSPAHLALHPFGRMPILEHGSFRLYETQAIMRYLDRVLPQPPLTPAGAEAAARMDQLMNINDWYLFQGGGATIGFQRVVGPKLLGMPSDEAAVAAAVPKARAAIDEVARLLGGSTWLTGDHFSLADLMLGSHLAILAETPEWRELAGHHANLPHWFARVHARPSMQATTWERAAAMAA